MAFSPLSEPFSRNYGQISYTPPTHDLLHAAKAKASKQGGIRLELSFFPPSLSFLLRTCRFLKAASSPPSNPLSQLGASPPPDVPLRAGINLKGPPTALNFPSPVGGIRGKRKRRWWASPLPSPFDPPQPLNCPCPSLLFLSPPRSFLVQSAAAGAPVSKTHSFSHEIN